MNLVLAILAAVAAIGAVAMVWFRAKAGQELGLMAATRTSTAAEVKSLAAGTLVELKGVLRCPAPVRGQYADEPAAYVRTLVATRR
jgi:hypothetical protein